MDRLDIKRVQIRDAWEEVQSGGDRAFLVGQVMTPAPSCIDSHMTVLELVKLFHVKEFRHLLVTDDSGLLKGVISDRDVIRCFGPGRYPQPEMLSQIRAEQIMSTDLITVQPDTSLERAIRIMLEHGVSCLPVMVGEKLVGILTNTDIQVVLHEMLWSSPVAQPAEVEWAG